MTAASGDGRLRLAIVDDHELVREGIRALLETHAPDAVAIVYSGGAVSEAIAAGPGVVLLDVELGPGAADVATNTASCRVAGIPVLLISAYDDAVAIRSGMHAGALGFVPKRVSYDQLMDALSTVAKDELYLSVDLAAMLASAADTPDLSPRELDALRLYASGLKLSAVAHRLGDLAAHGEGVPRPGPRQVPAGGASGPYAHGALRGGEPGWPAAASGRPGHR